MSRLTRRQFLSLSVTGLSLLAVPSLLVTHPRSANTYLYRLLEKMVADPTAAIWMGSRYLASHDDRPGIESFAQRLTECLSGNPQRDNVTLAARLQEHYRSDFNQRDTVILEQWLLPRSEARLFALLADSAPATGKS